ncbi:MAG: GDP-mannose 4,6-dehydratase [Patescibacteria group bacterium]
MENFWENRNVLITGANGFLAGWMSKALVDKGANLSALVYEGNPISVFETDQLHAKSRMIQSDILDLNAIKQILHNNKIQTVFHLGAQAICKTAIADPISTLDANIRGTINVLEAVRTVDPTIELVNASSDKAYGIHEDLPYHEHYPLRGEFPYEVSKSCADLISQMYYKTYNIPVCIVRSGNLYGGGDSHFSRIFPNTIRRVYSDMPPLLVNNSIRDYLYVQDAVDGYLMIGENVSRFPGEAFNLGHGKPIPVMDILTGVTQAMNKSHLTPVQSETKHIEIPSQHLSSAKIKSMLGWEPVVNLDQGLPLTVDWYCKYFDANRPEIFKD